MLKKYFNIVLLLIFANNVLANKEIDYSNQILEQTKKIDFTLEKIGQAINSGYIKVKEKNKAKNYILKTREAIGKILDNNIDYLKLANVNKGLIENLKTTIENDFSNTNYINYSYFLNNSLNLKESKNKELESLILSNEKNLNNIIKNLKNIGLTKLNILARSSEKLLKNNILTKKIKFFIKKSYPYFGLSSYLFYVNKKEDIKKIPVIGKYLAKIKEKVGTPDFKVKDPDGVKLNEIKEERSSYQEGYLSDISKKFSNLFSLESPKPIINLSISAYMASKIKDDAKNIFNWSLEKIEDINNILKGEKLKDRSIVKKVSSNFDSIAGYNSLKKELNIIVNYFKHKDLFELIGQKIPSVYLVNGEINLACDMIQALAGEITKVLSNKFCGIYNLSLNDLVEKETKDIKEIINKIEDFDAEHCIIILNNIDWIYTHAKNKTKLFSKLTELLKIIKSKKKISIFIATENYNSIDKSIIDLFECIININKPEKSDFKEFLIKFFKDRAIDYSNFDTDLLAEKSQTMSYSNLKIRLNKAISNSYLENKTISQEDLERALA